MESGEAANTAIFNSTNGATNISLKSSGTLIGQLEFTSGGDCAILTRTSSASLVLGSNNVKTLYITDDDRVGIGTASPGARLQVDGASSDAPNTSGTTTTAVARFRNASDNVVIDFGTIQESPWSSWIQCTDSANMANNYPLCLQSNGSNVGIGTLTPGAKLDIVQSVSDRALEVTHTGNNNAVYSILAAGNDSSSYVGVAEATDYAGHQINLGCYRTATDSWNVMIAHHGNDSNSPWTDVIFNIEGNGDVEGDGSYSSPAGDYAEYFESKDGKAIEVGTTVKLDGDKVVSCEDGDTPIGIIRPKQGAASVIGNKAQLSWHGKWLRDDYGGVILDENNNQQISSSHDPSGSYIPREKRDEWNLVGLLGQVQITKGQPVASTWIKMKDISDTVEMWLVK